jgi:hypothetical protein
MRAAGRMHDWSCVSLSRQACADARGSFLHDNVLRIRNTHIIGFPR